MSHPPQPSSFQTYPLPNGPMMKKHYENPADDPDYEPERQSFGYFLMIMGIIICGILSLSLLYECFAYKKLEMVFLAFCFQLFFCVKAVTDPKYLGGKPKISKLWPSLVFGIHLVIYEANYTGQVIQAILISAFVLVIEYFIHIQDDTNPNFCICLKPWVYKKKIVYQAQQFPIQYYPQAHPQSFHGYQPNAPQAYHHTPPQAFINPQQVYSVPQAHSPGPQARQEFQNPPSYTQSVPSKH